MNSIQLMAMQDELTKISAVRGIRLSSAMKKELGRLAEKAGRTAKSKAKGLGDTAKERMAGIVRRRVFGHPW